MAKQSVATANTVLVKRKPFQQFCINFAKNWQLHLLILIPVVYMLLVEYIPMYGLQMVFRDYKARAGLIGSEWVGMEQFFAFFENRNWPLYVWNTFRIASYSIIAGFPIPIILALILHVNENKVLKKVMQNVSYVPYFISVVVLVGIMNRVFDPYVGWMAKLAEVFDWSVVPNVMGDPEMFDHVYVWSGIWQSAGWGAIIYLSSLSSVSPELHEAARIDGASRLMRVIHVDIPAILPMICIQLIMRMGGILSVGYEKIYLMQNTLNLRKSEVISTYVYSQGLGKNNLSYGAAVGLMNGTIGTVMVVAVNWVTNKLSDGEAGLW